MIDKYDVIDSVYMKCSYKLVYVCDSNRMDKKSEDLQILQIGKSVSKYYSFYKWEHNFYVSESIKKDKDFHHIKKDAWSFEVFKNFPKNKITVTDVVSMLLASYIYEEDIPVFNWTMENEFQTVMSYSCQKATVNWRGRQWTAWFTQKIPISNGPWKFGGLPGLILKIYDAQNQFVFECNGLENIKKPEPIKYYKVDYKKITRSEMDKLYKRNHEDFVYYYYLATGNKVFLHNPKTKEFEESIHTQNKIPYNPIELK
ncbi:hypothetical protein FACS189429_6340 [Bacteroidia bacterium]|nr:hypothetical protein FACS189429_6340 [Bacteroidia bacterium]